MNDNTILKKAVKWIGIDPETKIAVEINQHSFIENPGFYSQPHIWCTYLLFSDELKFSNGEGDDRKLCAPYSVPRFKTDFLWNNRDALNCLESWNGGVTFSEFVQDSETGQRRVKIGDDFAHLWDVENRRFEIYDLEYMQRHIQKVAKDAAEFFTRIKQEEIL